MKHCHGRMMPSLPDQSIKPEMCRKVMNATMFDLPDRSIKLRMLRRRSYHVVGQVLLLVRVMLRRQIY